MARGLVPKLTAIFGHLVQWGEDSFLAAWGLADVVPVAKGSPSSDIRDYRPISITLLLSKVFEKIVVGKLSRF